MDELKEFLWIDKQLPLYSNFKQKVLTKAQQDLTNHTDITFTFEPMFWPRKRVIAIYFKIFENKKVKKKIDDEKMTALREFKSSWIGFSSEKMKEIFHHCQKLLKP